MKRLRFVLLLALLANVGCGGGGSNSSQGASLSGNWQIVLRRHVNPDPPLLFSGFLIQSDQSISGSVILGGGCPGVGPITGSIDNQKLSLKINEFGQDITLTGNMPSSGASMSGEFSNLAGGCTAFPNTGTWSAVRIPPLSGTFHGTFESSLNGTLEVSGTLTQGPNTGGSNATLSGTMAAGGAQRFCSYLPELPVGGLVAGTTVTGLISGTTVTLNLFGPNGTEITQIGTPTAPLTLDAQSMTLSGGYKFPAISSSCPDDEGLVQITFP